MFFTSQTCLDDSGHDLSFVPPQADIPNSLNSIVVTASEVKDAISCLKVGKASGPDGIDNRIWIQMSDQLSTPLSEIFKRAFPFGKCLRHGKLRMYVQFLKKVIVLFLLITDQYHCLILLKRYLKELFSSMYSIT